MGRNLKNQCGLSKASAPHPVSILLGRGVIIRDDPALGTQNTLHGLGVCWDHRQDMLFLEPQSIPYKLESMI